MEKSINTNILNDLLTRVYDSVEGYRLAADNVDDPSLEKFFRRQADIRAQFTQELSLEIRRFGGNPVDSGSWKGKLHRAWMNTRDAVASKDIGQMVEESIRGEEKALEEYSELLKDANNYSDKTIELIRKQRDEIKSSLSTLRTFEVVT